MRRASRLLLLLALLGTFLVLSGVPAALADHCSRGEGTLSGPALNGKVPSGKATWLGNSFCQPLQFEVEVKDVNLPDGTALQVDACGTDTASNIVGTITLRGGSGKLKLSKLDGDKTNDNVPFCDMRFGDPVNVLHSGMVILSGCISDSTGRIPGAPDC